MLFLFEWMNQARTTADIQTVARFRFPYSQLHVFPAQPLMCPPGPAPHLGYATWFGQRHMLVGTMSMRTIVPRTALAVRCREVNLRQGSQMASQLELGARAALCRQLAKREPANRVLWMAEAENWSRLSNEKLRSEPEQNSVTASCGSPVSPNVAWKPRP
jgi:hypothetical protein